MNNIVRMQPQQQSMPAIGERSGAFVWNGATWVPSPCEPCGPPPFPCPPSGFPPPGCPPWYSGANSPPWYPGANAGVSFGTTPPPNPVRGHFWWDGSTMWLFDGAAWSGIGGPGTGATASIGSSPPPNPQVGAMWFDGNALLVWDGARWVVANGNTATGSTPPPNPTPGTLWFNGTTLYVWDGVAWVPQAGTKSYIQPTAPPSPNPGDTWWDGTQMHIWDGHNWELVGPGAYPGPIATTSLQFRIGQPAALTIPASVWTIYPLTTTPTIDPQGMWDPVTHKITPKIPGQYMWRTIGENGGQVFGSCILKNDQGSFDLNNLEKIALWDIGAASIAGWWIGMGMAQFNGTTDYARLWGYTSTGSVGPIGPSPLIEAWLFP